MKWSQYFALLGLVAVAPTLPEIANLVIGVGMVVMTVIARHNGD